ncbi:carboxymuconolactone decarboxylase family protein [Rhizobium sp. CNPSo 4062]|uniref:carboxymuconolactone decarboxylase family protein n=1 Tax=Rhizobium sp. CNPSo 4062 TaxID=3021410 RepID=UPI0025502560|nr:carboxymuconolactone decarboxylase family protein [Rhizobium sp. CNPSo 4062]MDK4702823.1 carboxymuconolactone decarboxylase family protein [Rhizobium sp. CNPSo 4062]
MQARMKNPVLVLPETLQALLAVSNSIKDRGLSENIMDLVHLRISQINGCSVCTDMGFRKLQKAGETMERIVGVSAWREMPYFSDAERAALALGEAVTRLADRPDAVTDEIWNEATRHYDEKALSALIIAIAIDNVWNRLNSTVRQQAGASWN